MDKSFIRVKRVRNDEEPKVIAENKSVQRSSCSTFSFTEYSVYCWGDVECVTYSHTSYYIFCTGDRNEEKIDDGDWGGGGGGGDAPSPDPDPQPDPCAEAKDASENATALSKTTKFNTKLNEIRNAYNQFGGEHSVAFGKDASGNIITSNIVQGGDNSATVPTIQNRFADLHNHPTNIPPSSGDIYGFIDLAKNNPDYQRFITLPNGTVYALVITNLQKAIDFNLEYPRVPAPEGTTFEPDFPEIIDNEIRQMVQESNASKEISISYILEKYNCGIALLKENSEGKFKRQNAKEGPPNQYGIKTFQKNDCL
ncbi:MAG: hypothetical protein ABIN48_13525 [Ginsengibacter sp.]